MTDRPILFSSTMVRAILDGSKTQTRRVAPIRDMEIIRHHGDMLTWSVSFLKAVKGVLGSYSGGTFSELQARSIIASQFCRYGSVGDRLWVRETSAWLPDGLNADREHGRWVYRADHSLPIRWTPAIHMKRCASRIMLEITDVRVERLQDISNNDAKAEGYPAERAKLSGTSQIDAFIWFRDLWQSINSPTSWDANPWVWVIGFKRVEGGAV